MKATTAVPMTSENILWSKNVVPPNRELNDSTKGYSGPCRALAIQR